MGEQKGRYGDLIRQARAAEERQASDPGSQGASEPENQKSKSTDPDVNLCVKVPKSRRQHWAAMAKLKGTTLTATIVRALEAEFGRPE